MAENRTTVVEGRSSGTGVLIAVILLIAVIAGVYFFSQMSSSEANKDNAVANAANSVSKAANSAGEAAKDAAD